MPTFAQEAQQCGSREKILLELSNEYHEHVAFRAITVRGVMFEILVAPEGETFTVLLTHPSNPAVSCVTAAGADWQAVTPPSPGDPS